MMEFVARRPSYRTQVEELIHKKSQIPDQLDGIVFPKVLRTVVRTTTVTEWPKILVVHLNRSLFDSYATKNNCAVHFSDVLSVFGRTYSLNSVITHRGQHNSGHYETFRIHPQKGRTRFVRISDEHITLETFDNVQQQTQGAYMFFFERQN